MTTDELKTNWEKCGLEFQGKIQPLKNCFLICWGFHPEISDALIFDIGGIQGSDAYTLKMSENGENLISVNPENPKETSVLGRIVLL
jgi:hypothetical protein